jgi:hypothetical protein
VTVTVGAILFGAAAGAQVRDTGDLEAQHIHGLELRRQHRDAEARDLFRGLYERSREPRALARQAAAEAAMGDWLIAERHLVTALEVQDDPWIAQNRAGLESDLALIHRHLGALEVISDTPGAEVWISGERRATLPLTRPVAVRDGTVVYEVRAAGYVTEMHTVVVPVGAATPTRETVNLTRDASSQRRATRPEIGPVDDATRRDGASDTTGPRVLRIAGISGIVLGAAGLGVGVTGIILRNQKADAFNARPECGADAPAHGGDVCETFFDEGQRWQTVSTASFIAGGIILAGGLVMTVLGFRSRSDERPRTSVLLGPGPGQAGATVGVTF